MYLITNDKVASDLTDLKHKILGMSLAKIETSTFRKSIRKLTIGFHVQLIYILLQDFIEIFEVQKNKIKYH